ncbi:MAG: rane protein [Solirubrobacteraceae bacterium]|jgi:YihY family inner membrane protein|nr:rane protein [Solirubrobacteraceae bacterium]
MSRAGGWLKRFYRKAYEDNVTGLAGMVAYNMLLAILPLALIALFVGGQVLQSQELQRSVLDDLRRLFPTAAENTLSTTLHRIEAGTGRIGVAALVASVWIGASFWGALDTAFCRIYHVRCRSWLQQKRFALAMLAVALLFMAATVAVPTIQSILVSGAGRLPFGLADVRAVVYAISLGAGLSLLFVTLSAIYWTVPNEPVPWGAVWPGALAATLAVGLVDYAFPAYLSNVSTIARFGTTLVFVLIVLLWFYAVALIILGGAVTNALRFERIAGGDAEPS